MRSRSRIRACRAVFRVGGDRGEPRRAPVLMALRTPPVTTCCQRLTGHRRRDRVTQRATHRGRRARLRRHRRSSVARSTSATVGGGPSFHKQRNTTGGIIADTMSAIQLTRDALASAEKVRSAHDKHKALNAHRTGGYAAHDIMAGTLLYWFREPALLRLSGLRRPSSVSPLLEAVLRARRAHH